MKKILFVLLMYQFTANAQNIGAGYPVKLKGVPITSSFDSIHVQKAGFFSTISKANFITDLAISSTPAGSNTEIQFNNSGAFGASSNFVFNTSSNRLSIGGASSLNENISLTKNLSANASDAIVFDDNNSGAFIKFGDIASSGMSPYIQMIPDGTTQNQSYLLTNANNTGSTAALIMRMQNLAGSGTLSSQPLFDLQNYTTSVFKINANSSIDLTGKITKYNNSEPTNGYLLIGHTANAAFEAGTIASSGGTIAVQLNAGGINIDIAGAESTYTPTLTNTTNIAASTAYTTYYKRIGDWVHVWGDVSIDATAATTISEMGMSLPVASGVSDTYQLAGTASFEDNTSVQIKADVANGRAMWRFTPQSATNNKYSFHFSYKYIAP